MTAAPVDVISWGRERARAARWRGNEQVAFITPVPECPLPSTEFVCRCLQLLRERGFKRVVTGALSPLEQAAFLAAGFGVEHRLHLLGIDLTTRLPAVPAGLGLRRVPKRRWADVLAVDEAAFSGFWQFDELGLADSLGATPSARFRMAVDAGGGVAGYAICGRAGSRGFVQRLAVSPTHQREGTGKRLLLDGLHWLSRRGATRAVVNTQVGNDAALGLYLAAGFREEPVGLSVLSTGLP